jgi:two-component system sensor histidine kinase CpxA
MPPLRFQIHKFYFPLYAKVLLWFFVNLAVLAVVFYVFAREQFRVGLDSLLLGPAGDKIEAAGRRVSEELSATSRNQWGMVLAQLEKESRARLLLFGPEGRQLAGETTSLPPEVRAKMREEDARRPRPRGPGPRGGGPPGLRGEAGFPREGERRLVPPDSDGPPGLRGEAGFPPPPPESAPPGEGPPDRRGPPLAGPPPNPSGPLPKFIVRTTRPTRYWVGIEFPIHDPERPRPEPAVLLAVSSSLGGGPFLDLTPWLLIGGGVILLSVLLWFPVVRGITRSLSQITAATERIAEGSFDVEVTATRADELGRLARAVNRLATRLSGFVTGQKRFLGDIAHELCSPLARAEMALGVLEQKAGTEHREAVEEVREEVRHISNLVSELLSFSKAGLRAKDLALGAVPLRALAEKVVARETGGTDEVLIEIPGGLEAQAEPELLARALGNLLRNALRYAARAGPVTITATPQGEHVQLAVTDAGPGVPEEALAKLGEPFYRPEAARTREGGGAGLGLAIVRTCVEACRGTLTLRNLQPKGFEAAIRLRAS